MKLALVLTIITTRISLTYQSAIISKSMNTSQSSTFPEIEFTDSFTFDSFTHQLSQELASSNHDVTISIDLPLIPANLTSLIELLSFTIPLSTPNQTKSSKVNNGSTENEQKSKSLVNPRHIKLTPIEEEQLKLAHMTDTDLSCYIAPPNNTVVDMNKLMGMWYMVRTIKNANETDERYTCEEEVYTKTGPNTFDKVADVHFRHKWMTIHGNGTFIKPGILIIDWKDLTHLTTTNRLVYTILGTDYNQYIVGYNCRTGKKKAEIVLQTRGKRVPMTYLHKAFDIIRDNGLPFEDMDCSEGFGHKANSNPAGAILAPFPTSLSVLPSLPLLEKMSSLKIHPSSKNTTPITSTVLKPPSIPVPYKII